MDLKMDWTKPFLMEQKVAHIISNQEKDGCNFDRRGAQWGIHILTERILKIDHKIVPVLPMMVHKGGEYKSPFKLNGKPKAFVQKYIDKSGIKEEDIGGPFCQINFTPFDPSKTDRLKDVMMSMGWLPTEWNNKKMPFQLWTYRKKLDKTSYSSFINSCSTTDKDLFVPLVDGFIEKHFKNQTRGYMKAVLFALGFNKGQVPTFDQIKKRLLLNQFWPTSPKITEDSFDSVSEEEGETLKLLKERMIWSHRRSLIQGLVNQIRKDGTLPGGANPCATPTARMRHRVIVNIPAAGSPFGEECRRMFTGYNRFGSKPKVIRKLTKEMIESGKYRKVPNLNYYEINTGKGWEIEGHASYLIPEGRDAFVGGDGAGLELRMLTHYLIAVCKMLLEQAETPSAIKYYGDALESAYKYRDVLLNGDIHTHNQQLAGLSARKLAKIFI